MVTSTAELRYDYMVAKDLYNRYIQEHEDNDLYDENYNNPEEQLLQAAWKKAKRLYKSAKKREDDKQIMVDQQLSHSASIELMPMKDANIKKLATNQLTITTSNAEQKTDAPIYLSTSQNRNRLELDQDRLALVHGQLHDTVLTGITQ